MNDAKATSAMARLEEQLAKLPGIGRRSAQRLAFHLLKAPVEQANALASAIVNLKKNVRHCRDCFNLCESDRCSICEDPNRDRSVILVVEQPNDIASIEATGMYEGLYHVLMGRLSPLDGVGPGELNVEALLRRVASKSVREVILGTNPTVEGDGTALYLSDALQERGVKVSRLARGLPTGTNIEQASKAVLTDALQGRKSVD
jgi:recombination protein RecR